MSTIITDNERQYADSRNLNARARLHSRFTVAETDWFSWLGKHLPLSAGDKVVDVGCGPGWLWTQISGEQPAGLDLTLTDLSAGMVEEAMARCRSLPFASISGQQADASALPFEDASFDVVTSMHMLYHLPDPAIAIAEMHRVLKPGGLLAVTTNGAGNLRELYELTTVFGSPPVDPSALAFDFEAARRLMTEHFGNVTTMQYPAILRVDDPEAVFRALISYPPGDDADEIQLAALRDAITQAFHDGGGMLEASKEVALLISRKAE